MNVSASIKKSDDQMIVYAQQKQPLNYIGPYHLECLQKQEEQCQANSKLNAAERTPNGKHFRLFKFPTANNLGVDQKVELCQLRK